MLTCLYQDKYSATQLNEHLPFLSGESDLTSLHSSILLPKEKYQMTNPPNPQPSASVAAGKAGTAATETDVEEMRQTMGFQTFGAKPHLHKRRKLVVESDIPATTSSNTTKEFEGGANDQKDNNSIADCRPTEQNDGNDDDNDHIDDEVSTHPNSIEQSADSTISPPPPPPPPPQQQQQQDSAEQGGGEGQSQTQGPTPLLGGQSGVITTTTGSQQRPSSSLTSTFKRLPARNGVWQGDEDGYYHPNFVEDPWRGVDRLST
ncbi:MAG: hypothetical protein M1816_000866 [Peltula sp. TS41687]|nr:MAG: hypothetical protein M1816_000866 [Peltula sp. TS41687]